MPRRIRVKRIDVKIGSIGHERSSKIGEGLEKGKSKEGIERFIIPGFGNLKPFPLQLHPFPFEPKAEAFGIKEFRQLLSDEKARILATIKTKKPVSIYSLAKMLERDFKAVRNDVKLLENFGFLKLVAVKDKGKKKLKPVLALDRLEVTIEI